MRIKKLILKNYRQFEDIELKFDNLGHNDLQIFVAPNGTGKSTLLNAINWCLYGDEPHLTEEPSFPLLNLKTIEESNSGDEIEVKVELWVSSDKGTLKFIRSNYFAVYEKNDKPILQKSSFKVKSPNSSGDTDILIDEEANDIVEQFVPKNIREYFFFDGERLDKYFLENRGERILNATFKISRIELLCQVRKHLNDVYEDLMDDASILNPEIESLNEKERKLTKETQNLKNSISSNENQISIAKEKVAYYRERLTGYPKVEQLVTKREALEKREKIKEQNIEKKLIEKRKALMRFGIYLMLFEPVNDLKTLINKKIFRGEIPPSNITPELLDEILEKGICICENKIDDEIRAKLKLLLKDLKKSSDLGTKLTNLQRPLKRAEENIETHYRQIQSFTEDIKILDDDIIKFDEEIDDIRKQLLGYDEEDAVESQKELLNFEKSHENHIERRTELKHELTETEEKIEEIKEEIKLNLKNEEKLEEIKKQTNFLNKALKVIDEIKDEILTETRKNIELRTNEIFFDLIWKKETYDQVLISDTYDIDVKDRVGFSCRGSLSAAEKQFLSLAFTLALHEVSGFYSPLIIDTPVSRVSDINRENFGVVFSAVSKEKQIILLLTPSDYDKDLKKSLDVITKRYNMKLSKDEKYIIIQGDGNE